MTAVAKICGINDAAAMRAAVGGGAAFIGLVFYPPSPRAVTPEQAGELAGLVPDGVTKVGLFVDPSDADIDAAMAAVSLDMIQLHGAETPQRVGEIKARSGRAIMKAFGIEAAADLDRPAAYLAIADYLLFDGLGDPESPIPGGNAADFDWRLLEGRRWPLPWMLAGGLTPDNVARAIAATGAEIVDVSSGVEAARGKKDPALISAFLAAVAAA